MYDPLLLRGEDGELRPFLAEEFKPDDSLTEWTVTLRPDVTFHDGEALDAAALKEAFDEYLKPAPSNLAGALAEVLELRVDGPLTVTYVLGAPNAAFGELLTGPIGWPFSVVAARAAGKRAGESPVGTGPFRFESWARDERLVLVKNDAYWRPGLPHLDELTFRPIPDESTRLATMLSGGIDVIQSLSGPTITELQASSGEGYRTHLSVGDDASVTLFNTQRPPFDDVRVRRAWAHSIDKVDTARLLGVEDLVTEATQHFSQDSPWFSEKVAATAPVFDMDLAQELVDDYVADPDRSDGKAVGESVEVEFQCVSEPLLLEIAQNAKARGEALGIDVTLASMEQSALFNRMTGDGSAVPPYRAEYSASCSRLFTNDDPYATFRDAFGSPDDQLLNLTDFVNPEIVELTNRLKRTVDFDKRAAIVEEIGLIINDEVPISFSLGTPAMVGVRDGVENVDGWTLPDGTKGTGVQVGATRWSEVWLDG